jgi:protoheme IX farnesyltransferase
VLQSPILLLERRLGSSSHSAEEIGTASESLALDCGAAGAVDATVARETLRSTIGDYLELGKARLSSLVLLTTLSGYFLAALGPIDWLQLAATLVGTMLAALGANAFNQLIEAERDKRMHRTRNRPLPAGRLTRRQALVFASACGIVGPGLLSVLTSPLAGFLAAACLVLYVVVYTPMKVRSTMNTMVGAVVGALPPMVGWAAAAGTLEAGAWVLGAILFIWQIPHFLALAWLYREDYERGGFRMLPGVDPSGSLTFRAIVLYSFALVPAGLMLTLVGATGLVFAAGSLALGLAASWVAIRLYRTHSAADARRVFFASIIYLPLLLGLMMVDRGPAQPHLSSRPDAPRAVTLTSR